MKALLSSLAMAVSFWIPATVAVMMIASSIPMKNLHLAIVGAIVLLVSVLFRVLIRHINKEEDLVP